MKIEFKYVDDYSGHNLIAKTDHGEEIEIWFNGLDADCIYIDGLEVEVNNDTLKRFAARIGGEWVEIATIIQEANKQIEGIVAQTEQEDADEDAMASDLSSPYYSGGI